MATQFVLIVDTATVAVSMKSIREQLESSVGGPAWGPNAYAVGFAGALLLGVRLADHVGSRRMFLAGLAAFTLTSLAGGLSTSTRELVTCRALQGLAAALISPAALSMVIKLVPSGSRRDKALVAWAALSCAGGAVGLLHRYAPIGLGWEAIFFANAPIGLAIIVMGRRTLPVDGPARRPERFDVTGAVTLAATLTLLVYALVRAPESGWGSVQAVSLLASAALSFVVFVIVEMRAQTPLVPLGIARRRLPTAGNVVGAVTGAAMIPALFYLVSFHTQHAMGYSPGLSGLAQLPMACLIMLSAAVLAPRLTTHVGGPILCLAGLSLAFAGLVWLSQAPFKVPGYDPEPCDTGGFDCYAGSLLGPLILTGLGAGLVFAVAIAAAIRRDAEAGTGLASGLLTSAQQTGAAIGLAVIIPLVGPASADLIARDRAPGGAPAEVPGLDRSAAPLAALAAILLTMALLPRSNREST